MGKNYDVWNFGWSSRTLLRKGDSIIVHGIIPVIDRISAELNIPVIDLYHPFLDKGSLFPDAIHPDKEGAGIMAEIIGESIRGK